MSKEQKPFTDEEKRSIALKAIAEGEESIQELAEKHDISEEEIKKWVRETDISPVKQDEDVSLQATDDFIASVNYGANYDNLNYRRLFFWSIFGMVILAVIIQSIMFIHDYTESSATQLKSEQSQYYDIDEIRFNDQERLETFGVVDSEAGIYRIPIDSAITLIVNE